MDLYSGGLIVRRIFASEIWRAYFREGSFLGVGGLSEFYVIHIQLDTSQNVLLLKYAALQEYVQ